MSRFFRLFGWAAERRSLWALAALTLASGAAMLPTIATMSDHGASLFAFESAGSAARSREILAGWGDAGKTAMWWQLALDIPFLIGYGLLLAGACTAAAGRAHRCERPRLARLAATVAWFGPLAAAADLLQDISLALVLGGHVAQPWPRISALAAPLVTGLCAIAALVALYTVAVTRHAENGGALRPERP